MLSRWAVIFKMSELKISVLAVRWDYQKILLKFLIVLLIYLIDFRSSLVRVHRVCNFSDYLLRIYATAFCNNRMPGVMTDAVSSFRRFFVSLMRGQFGWFVQ